MEQTQQPARWRPISSGAWDRLFHHERTAYLAGLDDAQIVVQARMRAEASGKKVGQVLTAWVLNGFLDYERKTAIAHELGELGAIDPEIFYALPRRQQRLALALLGPEERFAFAAACAAYLSDLYHVSPPLPVAEVRRAWRRVGIEV